MKNFFLVIEALLVLLGLVLIPANQYPWYVWAIFTALCFVAAIHVWQFLTSRFTAKDIAYREVLIDSDKVQTADTLQSHSVMNEKD